MKDLAKRIEEITKKNGLTGKELGEKLGLKKTPITDWKNGKAKPTLEQMKKRNLQTRSSFSWNTSANVQTETDK